MQVWFIMNNQLGMDIYIYPMQTMCMYNLHVIYTHAWHGCVRPSMNVLLNADTPAPIPLSRHISSRQACAPLLSLPLPLKRALLYILWFILMHGNTSHDVLAVVVRNLHSQLLQAQFRNLLEEKYLATFTQSSLKYSAVISHAISLWR